MSTFAECLASFINWPHASPSAEDLADAGFSRKPTIKEPDNVICQICKTQLCDWQSEDNPKLEHYRRSRSYLRVALKTDPTLIFVQSMTLPGNKEASQGTQSVEKKATTQQAKAQQYHKCTICMASFSSISRLLSHSQSASCGKPSCKHCEEVFESKNQLHKHIREECSMTKSKGPNHSAVERQTSNNTGLPSENITPVTTESTLRAIGTSVTHIPTEPSDSASRSPTPSKSSVTPLASTEKSSSLPTYRSISPSPPAYTSRSYLTIDDLYMRYAPLKHTRYARQPARQHVTVSPTLTVHDLYERFHGKTNPINSHIKIEKRLVK